MKAYRRILATVFGHSVRDRGVKEKREVLGGIESARLQSRVLRRLREKRTATQKAQPS